MNHVSRRALIRCAGAFLTLTGTRGLLTGAHAAANESGRNIHGAPPTASKDIKDIAVELSFDRTDILQGEALILRYTIKDLSGLGVYARHAHGNEYWLEMFLEDEKKCWRVPLVISSEEGIYQFMLSRNGSRTGTSLVRPEQMKDAQPGRCVLHVRVRMCYSTGTGAEPASDADIQYSPIYREYAHREDYPVYQQEFSLPVTIARFDASALRARANQLRKTILSGQGTPEDIIRLFAMPAAHAMPQWRALIRTRETPPGLVAAAFQELVKGAKEGASGAGELLVEATALREQRAASETAKTKPH